MDKVERRAYLKWWIRLFWWQLFWLVLVLVVACIVASPGEIFGDASALVTVAYLAFVYGAATSPLLAWGFWLGSSTRELARAIDEALQPWIEEGVNWRLFSLVVIGGPVFTAVLCVTMHPSADVLTMLAELDAVLVVAIVVDSRSTFAMVGHGASARTQTTMRLAFLWAIAFGVIIAATGAITAQSEPPAGLDYDLALGLSLGYGLFACIAATLLLTMNAAARLVEAHADAASRRGDE